MLMIYTVGLYD